MRLSRVVAGFACLVVAACSVAAPPGDEVSFQSASPAFIDALLAGDEAPAVTVRGRLMVPAAPAPWPAVVMLHSASGQGAIDWSYADLLIAHGYAVLAVDSFSPRGAFRTVADQTEVSEAAIVLDAYRALDLLVADPRFDPDRIAVLGFSKGGIAALYSAFERVREAARGRRFAAHVAHYPWCGLMLRGPVTTGAPVLIQSGGNDDIAPAGLCRELVDGMVGGPVDLVVYDGARHAFDHPALDSLPWVPVTGMIPGDCRLVEQADGSFRELTTGQTVTGEGLRDVLVACGRRGAEAGGDAGAAAEARRRLMAFLGAALAP